MNLNNTDLKFKCFDTESIGDIYHVGTMDISRKSQYSLEGNGLSVSNCPDAWVEITEGHTHGDYFLLSKPDIKLLDFYALTVAEMEYIQNWAIENGYVTLGPVYKTTFYNEYCEECYSVFSTYEEAFEDVGDDELIEEIKGLLPTDKLEEQSLVKLYLMHIPYTITALFAEQVLDYDGIWWNEELNIDNFSAPRGVIFNSKLSSFDITKEVFDKETIKEQADYHSIVSSRNFSNTDIGNDSIKVFARLGISLDVTRDELNLLMEGGNMATDLLIDLVRSEKCKINGDTYFPQPWNEEYIDDDINFSLPELPIFKNQEPLSLDNWLTEILLRKNEQSDNRAEDKINPERDM